MRLSLIAKPQSYLYHLVNQDRMLYILNTNSLQPYNFAGGISCTRDPDMTGYTGSQGMVLFRLVLDQAKLARDFKIRPINFKSQTGVVFEEAEDFIVAPRGVSNLQSYLVEIQAISEAMTQWRIWMTKPEDDWDRRQAEEFENLMQRLPGFAKVVEV